MSKMIKTICFGEVLVDVFPDGERIGGAPLNVAARLASMGAKSEIISKVGKDQRGKKIMSFLQERGIGTAGISEDEEYPTGVVEVSLSNSGSASYEISYPSAWDNILATENVKELVGDADAFVFGSLACRNEVSRRSLFELIPYARFKVLDFNLRPPHYSEDLLAKLLRSADFVKLNDDELFEIAAVMGAPYFSLEQNLHFIANNSSASSICVTKGRHGAVILHKGKLYYNSGYKIKVRDTVGAGDSFLASLLLKYLSGEPIQHALDYACAVGALVAGEKGANPRLVPEVIKRFLG